MDRTQTFAAPHFGQHGRESQKKVPHVAHFLGTPVSSAQHTNRANQRIEIAKATNSKVHSATTPAPTPKIMDTAGNAQMIAKHVVTINNVFRLN
jgi:hypothetical protein